METAVRSLAVEYLERDYDSRDLAQSGWWPPMDVHTRDAFASFRYERCSYECEPEHGHHEAGPPVYACQLNFTEDSYKPTEIMWHIYGTRCPA